MKVPLLDLKAQYVTIKSEVRGAIDEVLDSQFFVGGPALSRLEEQIAAYSDVKFGIGVSSGTDALLCAMLAMGIGPGDEVITTPFTFFSTGGCVSRLGAKLVFVDIDPETYNIDPAKIAPAITDKTKLIVPVHLFGQVADMDPILEVAGARDLFVMEDAAQAIGAVYKERKACTFGHVNGISFYPSKNLGAFGDGGMVLTNDQELADKCRILRVHGGKPKYYHAVIGGNFRLDSMQAAILSVKLRHLDKWSQKRRENAARYDEYFAGSKVGTPKISSDCVSIYNQYCIRVPDRDGLKKHLAECEVGTDIYYPVPLHLQQCFKDLGYKEGDLPVSERAAKEVLAIPIFPELTVEQQRYVADRVLEYYK